jgi:hypothetical protein
MGFEETSQGGAQLRRMLRVAPVERRADVLANHIANLTGALLLAKQVFREGGSRNLGNMLISAMAKTSCSVRPQNAMQSSMVITATSSKLSWTLSLGNQRGPLSLMHVKSGQPARR